MINIIYTDANHIKPSIQQLADWSNTLISQAFPQFCLVCKQRVGPAQLYCSSCIKSLSRVRISCPRCGQSLGQAGTACGKCLNNPCPQGSTVAPFWFEYSLASQIKAFKYSQKPELAKPLARLLAEELQRDDGDRLAPLIAQAINENQAQAVDEKQVQILNNLASAKTPFSAIIPIPSEPNKLKQRGFNPAALLAHYIGKSLRVKVHYRLLLKKPNANSQVGSSRAKRLRQAQGQFLIRPQLLTGKQRVIADSIGQKILLIDDVLTTGATLHHASKALLGAGAQQVHAACIALSP